MRLRNLFKFWIVCPRSEICMTNRFEMPKKRKSLLILGKVKMNDALNRDISTDRFASLFLPFLITFCQYFCRFHNAEAKTQELSFLSGDEILPRLRARQTRNVISRSIVAEVMGSRESRRKLITLFRYFDSPIVLIIYNWRVKCFKRLKQLISLKRRPRKIDPPPAVAAAF